MTKTIREYEELFEDLMEYTDFKSSSEVKTKKDLLDFFNQVKDDAHRKKRKFTTSKRLFHKMVDVLRIVEREGEVIKRKVERAKKSKKMHKSFKSAKMQDLVVIVKDKPIYKSYSKTIKKKVIVRWRNEKGRFVRSPE